MKRILTQILILISAAQLFAAETGIQPRWITKAQSQAYTNSWIAYRKNVTIDTVPSSVKAKVAVDTKYWMWINDSLVVYEGGLKRGPKPGATYYDVVEIAPYLKSGRNLIAILTWHLGKSGFSHVDSGLSALMFDAVSEDGSLRIVTGKDWECSEYLAYSTVPGPLPNYRLPESNVRFDARLSFGDWNRLSGTKKLGSAMVVPDEVAEAAYGELVKRPVPLWKDHGVKAYVSVEREGDVLKCRLPYNCHVSPILKVNAPSGRLITIQTDHSIVTNAQCIYGQYVTRSGVQEYEQLNWINGDWVYYTVPKDVEVLEVKYRETGFDTEFAGSFHCDDPLLNRYWEMATRTLYVCMRDTYYDCPDRERAQWWGDEVVEIGEAFYALSRSADKLARKGILELVGWQRADGAMYAPVPTSNYFCELPNQILASVGLYGFHNYWFYSGDDSILPLVYDAVHKYLHETWQLDGNGLPIYRTGEWDWGDTGTENLDRAAQPIPWYSLALQGERRMALELGKTADAAEDDAIIARIKDSFNRIYWNGSEYRTPTYTEIADDRVQALAVLAGLADVDKYPAIRTILARQNYASAYMEKYVLEALFRMGESGVAFDKMRALYPTIMSDEHSTLYEAWDFGGTSNHAWAGGGIVILSGKVAGIEPLEPGFRVFSVNPDMGPLKTVDASVPTSYGSIEVSLRRKGSTRIEMKLTVPEGTKAEVPLARGNSKSFGPGVWTIKL